MGAWDTTAFGNDDACDWAGELLDAKSPLGLLRDTLALAAEADDYLEAPDGSRIVAAAAVIATAFGQQPDAFPEKLRAWLPGQEKALRPLAPAAAAALERVRAEDSELKELWEESAHAEPWNKSLDAIASALAG